MKKIMMMLFIACAAFLLSINVNAELIDNGKYTSDTATGLDWLDLTVTRGLSYNTVLSQLESGNKFDGWSYATQEQINVLFSNAGIVKGLKTGANILSISRLLDLWGIISLRSSKESGDSSKFMYGSAYAVGLPKKNNQRVYVGYVGKIGVIGKERGLVLLNNVKSSLSINESKDKTGSALIRKTK